MKVRGIPLSTWVLVWMLVFETIVGPTVSAYAANPAPAPERIFQEPENDVALDALQAPTNPLANFASPALDLVQAIPPPALEGFQEVLRERADNDPYFLRSQSWLENSQTENIGDDVTTTEPRLEHKDGATRVFIPGAKKSWEIQAPLKAIGSHENYLFFKPVGTLAEAQGLFIVRYPDLVASESAQAPVPVFFFPLPEGVLEQTSEVFAPEFENESLRHDGFFVLSDGQKSALWILDRDIDEMLRREATTLLFATGLGLQVKASLPPRGSTAGYGLLFTGLDFDHPENQSLNWETALFRGAPAKSFFPDFIASAHAGTPLNSSMVDRLIRFGVIANLAFVAAVGLKYTVLRARFVERRKAFDEILENKIKEAADLDPSLVEKRTLLEKEITQSKKWNKGLRREVIEVFDTYAHVLTFLLQIAPAWFANGLEYLGDRFAPSVMSGASGWVRKLLDRTVFFVRDAVRRTPVNHKTFLLGSITHGMNDSLHVVGQTFFIVPTIAHTVANWVPSIFGFDLKGRVDAAYGLDNSEVRSLQENAVVKTFASWWVAGSGWFSVERSIQHQAIVKKDVREEMLRQGLDPTVQSSEFDKRYQQRMALKFRELGLPGPEGFLFDAMTTFQKITTKLGFRLDERVAKAEPETRFLGLARPGLVTSALKRAISNQKNFIKRKDLTEAERSEADASLGILRRSLSEISLSYAFFSNPLRFRSNLAEHRKNHQAALSNLIALTYEGPVTSEIRNLPGGWYQKLGEKGAAHASHAYRKAFMDLYLGADSSKPLKKESDVRKFNFYEKRQLHQILKATKAKDSGPLLTEERQRIFLLTFANEYANHLGLYPYYDHRPELRGEIETKAWNELEEDIARRPELKVHLAQLWEKDRDEAIRFKGALLGTILVPTYISAINADASVDALHPARPGRLQKLRQTDFLKKNSKFTKVLRIGIRTLEAPFSDAHVELGMMNEVFRKMPWLFDYWNANVNSARRFITNGTAVYWFNYLVWGVNLTAAQWLWTIVLYGSIAGPSQFVQRWFSMTGMQVGSRVLPLLTFSTIYSYLTFWGEFPMQILAGDFLSAFRARPVQTLVTSIALVASPIAAAVAGLQVAKVARSGLSKLGNVAKKLGAKVKDAWNSGLKTCQDYL